MAWLDNLLGRGSDREVEEKAERQAPRKPTSPPLLLLVSDASGMAALRLVKFDDSRAACEYVEFWYPNRSAGTVYAVWALPGEPDSRCMAAPEHRGEAVILLRDDRNQDIVYPFSFNDFHSAWEFLREEMQHDLDPARVMINWAVPVDIEVDDLGKIHMSPDAPPPWAPAGATPRAHEACLEEAERMFEDAADDVPADIGQAEEEAGVEGDTPEPAEAVAQNEETEEEAVIAGAVEPIEALPELVIAQPGTPFHQTEFTEPPAPDDGTRRANGNGKDGNGRRDNAAEELRADSEESEEVKLEQPTRTREKSSKGRRRRSKADERRKREPAQPAANGHEPSGDGHSPAHEATLAPANGDGANGNGHSPANEPTLASADSHRTNGNGHSPAKEPTLASANGHKANGNGQSASNRTLHGLTNGYEMVEEISRVLEGRKLTRQDGPFKGFNSPRGRF